MDCLKRGIRYEHLPSVRTAAIEALAVHGGEPSLPWVRNALNDTSPAVRFAAAMALGDRQDAVAVPALRKLLANGEATDRIGAIYALHRLGETQHTGALAEYLLQGEDVSVRANAALVLGRIGGEGATRLLSLALTETHPAMRVNVLEAMALLGSDYAIEALHAGAYGGIGAEEVFAINTLARLRDPRFAPLYRLRMESALHLESKLAAASALGMLGDRSGYSLAHDALTYRATEGDKQETAENRTRRVQEMAAHALGAIADTRALPAIERLMHRADDPRTQIAAAKAILDIQAADAAAQRLAEGNGVRPPPIRTAEGARR
jgi:HEAT repeat protein